MNNVQHNCDVTIQVIKIKPLLNSTGRWSKNEVLIFFKMATQFNDTNLTLNACYEMSWQKTFLN